MLSHAAPSSFRSSFAVLLSEGIIVPRMMAAPRWYVAPDTAAARPSPSFPVWPATLWALAPS